MSSGVKSNDADGVFEDDFFDTNAPANFAPTDGVFGDRAISTSDFIVTDYFPNNDVLGVDRFTETIKQTLTHVDLQQLNSIAFYKTRRCSSQAPATTEFFARSTATTRSSSPGRPNLSVQGWTSRAGSPSRRFPFCHQ